MGQLRGLAHPAELARSAGLTMVSGSTYAATLWCWAKSLISNGTLPALYIESLGALRRSSGPLGANLGSLDKSAIGQAATQVRVSEILSKAIDLSHENGSVSELWLRAIGSLVLGPFGPSKAPQRTSTERVTEPENRRPTESGS